MTEELFGERKRALEDSFFREQDKRLIARLQAQRTKQEARQAIREATGITEEATLDRLVALELGADTLLALELVPLVAVAWADGQLDDRERQAVLAGIEAAGLQPGSAPHSLVQEWLRDAPPPLLVEAWTAYARTLGSHLGPAERETVRARILGRARAVAEAAGGFLGLGGKVSKAEEEVLAALERALAG